MKKIVFILFCLLLLLGATAQEKKFSPLSVSGDTVQEKKFSHWSVTLEGGISKFDGDINQKYNEVIPNSFRQVCWGASVEYNLTPIWSVGADYYNLPSRASASYYTLSNLIQTAELFVGMNITKTIYKNTKSKWNLWLTLGAGLAVYNVDYVTQQDGMLNESSGLIDRSTKFNDGMAVSFPVGALIEYNINKSLALGARLVFRGFNKDNLDGRNFWGVTNDYVEYGVLQLRWKINAIKKDHLRNVKMDQFMPNQDELLIAQLQNRLDNLQNKLDKMNCDGPDTDCDGVPDCRDLEPNTPKGSRVDAFGRSVPCLNETKPAVVIPPVIQKLEGEGLDTDGDGVPDSRDLEPNTPPNTPVDFWGRSLSLNQANGEGAVYFDFDKTDLDAEAHATIQSVAQKMKILKDVIVEVRGFCDYMGTNDYNLRLSRRRAEKVQNELIYVYHIDPERIITNGKGRILEPKAPTRANRRCNFFFNTK
jgi:outer membrane protein OmpA-like peptidoglycan-associated protein